jgi:hypothetical protein
MSQESGMFVQCTSLGQRNAALAEDDLAILHARKAIRCKVVRALLWHQDEMRVRDAEAMHQHSHSQRLEDGHQPTADALRDYHNPLGRLII